MARVRTTTFLKRKQNGERIAVLTAYDYPSAKLVDEAGIDAILVGDTLGVVVQGQPDTLPVTMDDMVYHTRLVSRAVERAMVIGDMPFMSYQVDTNEAVRNAGRLVAEGGANAVKLEGPADKFGDVIGGILRAGIPVMGHIGLTPQSVNQIGGYKLQGREPEARERLKEQALGLQEAGCFAVVLEFVKADIAAEITELLSIPTIGIGSGVGCDGQVLVFHDMLGLGHAWTFVKVFADAKVLMKEAVEQYKNEVLEGTFPGPEHEFK